MFREELVERLMILSDITTTYDIMFINWEDTTGCTALKYAWIVKDVPTIDILLKKGAMYYTWNNQVSALKMFISIEQHFAHPSTNRKANHVGQVQRIS